MEKLTPFLLENVEGLDNGDNPMEAGAYGVVSEVSVNGLPCMAKRLHAILVHDVSKAEKTEIERKFSNECLLLSTLTHPNIVRFIGVCYLSQAKDDLALVMEKLKTDLAAFVRKHPNIPLPIKISVALDVSYGLLYLHNQTPPIIHRDLTAPNVLLSIDLRAKIADLGVSKVLDNPLRVTMTTAPGNVNYMAPETKFENPQYGPPLDVFSFGHLLLHLSIQDWPPVYETGDHTALQQGVMEISKRRKVLDSMGETHPLHHLATDCLHDNPDKRPPVVAVNKTLANLATHQYPKSFTDILDVTDECEKSHLTGELEEQGARERQLLVARIEGLETERLASAALVERLGAQLSEREEVLKTQHGLVATCQDEKEGLCKENKTLKETAYQLRLEMQADREKLEKNIRHSSNVHDELLINKGRLEDFEKKVKSLKGKLSDKELEVVAMGEQLAICRQEHQQLESQHQQAVERSLQDSRILQQQRESLSQEFEKMMRESRDQVEKVFDACQERLAQVQLDNGVGQQAVDHLPDPSNLPGVEIVAMTTLIITQAALKFKWDGMGIELDVPANSIPAELESCVVKLYSSLSGQYLAPDGHEVVSCILWIRPHPFVKFQRPITLQLQHCVQKAFLKNLTFCRAVCTQETLPYVFRKIDGGVFSEESCFGIINLDHFSGFAICSEGIAEKMYNAGLYYLGRDAGSWEVHLVVTWDTEAHNTAIQRHYERREAVEGPNTSIEFEGDNLTLDLPMNGVTVGKWTLRPLVTPQLAKRRVDYYTPGRRIPHCQLTAKIPGGPVPPNVPELVHPLAIGGAKEPYNMITIEIDPRRPITRRPRYSLRGEGHDEVNIGNLVQHTGVTEVALDQVCTETGLALIAPRVNYLMVYARSLLREQEAVEIDSDKGLDAAMKSLRVLKSWKRRLAFKATYKRLVEVCLSLNDALLAEHVCTVALEQVNL